MPVPRHQADRVVNVHTREEQAGSHDEVIHLGTVIRHHGPKGASYVANSTMGNATGRPTSNQNTHTRADALTNRAAPRLKHAPRQGARPAASPLKSRHRSRTSHRQTEIPSYIVAGSVKLGWSQSSDGRKQRVAYGSFSRAGRFRCWLGGQKSTPIAQKDVVYCPRFRDMTPQQVRAEVYRTLTDELGDTGEV